MAQDLMQEIETLKQKVENLQTLINELQSANGAFNQISDNHERRISAIESNGVSQNIKNIMTDQELTRMKINRLNKTLKGL